MNKKRIASHIAGLALACGFLSAAHAAPTSREILCSAVNVTQCQADADCESQSTLAADVPLFLRLDLNEKTVETTTRGGRKNTTVITGMSLSDGLLLLQGVEPAVKDERSAIGWTISLDESTGGMVITASGRDVSYALFGGCTTID